MTFSFAELLAAAPILPDLSADDEEAAIRAVAGLLKDLPTVADAGKLTAEVLEREKLSPTAMGHGVAFPHARTGGVRQIVMAIGRSREGVAYKGAADGPVHFFFVIGTPPNQAPQYLMVVGRLARLLKSEAVREDLLAATTAQAVREILGREE